jgi:putative ABC transport system permease protein
MIRDVRYAIRSLLRSRGFTVAAILTLAIGIGAATAIYSVVDTILLRPLPFPQGDRLVTLIEWAPHPIAGRPPLRRGLTYTEFLDWRSKSKTLSDAAATIPMAQRMVKTPDGAAGLWGAAVSSNAFEMLQARAMLGRAIATGDDRNPDVVVLSHDVWRLHYHSDPRIIGKALEFRTGALLAPIPTRLLTVIGVMPADFQLPTGPLDFFTPFVPDPSKQSPRISMLATLAGGVSLQAATEDALLMGNAIRPPWPEAAQGPAGPRFEIQSLKEQAVAPLRPALQVLLAAVVVVLLIVCANVANLMLARGTARQREIAVRLSIGASRAQIVRQILIESMVLAVVGGVLGAAIGSGGVMLVKQLAAIDAPGIFRLMFGSTILPRGHEIGVSWRLFTIAFGIAAIACVMFGMLPALLLSRTDHLHALTARGSAASRGAARLRGTLVAGQLVLATMLLVGAGLLANSFMRLATFDKGYNPQNVLAFNLLFPDRYSTARKAETIETLLHRFRSKPAVQAAGFARHGLLIGEELYIGHWVPRGRSRDEMRNERIRVRNVSDGFLTAMGVPILGGRDLSPADDATAPLVVVINRSMAAKYFTGDAVGQTIDWYFNQATMRVKVVGVVEAMRQVTATDELVPEAFVDYRQYMKLEEMTRPATAATATNEGAIGFLSFAVRTANDPASHIPEVREAVAALDSNIGIDAIAPMTDLEASSTARERFYAVLLGVFATVAALLAAIGIYGVLAYSVVQRTQEIGVRVALGAKRGQVIALVMRRGLILTATGLSVGLAAAAASARYLQSMLFGIEPLDFWTFTQVAVAFTAIAMLASYLPARRATAIDPVVALRQE